MEHWTSYITNNKFVPTKIPNFDENSEINKRYIKTKKHMKEKGFDLFEPYQTFALWWGLEREGYGNGHSQFIKGGLILDEMGLGKTVESISLMVANRKRRTLIILPTSLIDQWYELFKKIFPRWYKNHQIFIHHGKNKIKDKLNKKIRIVITTHHTLLKDNILNKIKWRRIIIDESHIFRNMKTKKTQNFLNFQSKIIWSLTGTPIQNSKQDLITQFHIIGYKSKNEIKKNLEKLTSIHLLRRTKKEVQKYNKKLLLKPKIVDVTYLDFSTDEERDFYRHIRDNSLAQLRRLRSIGASYMQIFEILIRLRQAITHPQILIEGFQRKHKKKFESYNNKSTKINYLIKKINQYPQDKSIIFCTFRKEIDLIEEALINENINVATFDGRISLDKKKEILKKCSHNNNNSYKYQLINLFNKKNIPQYLTKYIYTLLGGDIKVLIMNIESAACGLNLQKFNHIFFTSIHWNPSMELQAIGRAHRIGQEKTVYVEKLLIQDNSEGGRPTIDERIEEVQTIKREIMAELLNDENLKQKYNNKIKLTRRDLNRLFRI